jgi:EAL domain-containing protein (putative c-di-GMP-specific phosphodiesterase class I)
MKRGLTQDIFKVHYQPIFSLKRARFTSAEALLRLSDSELGAISPVEFIPIAQEAGIIVDIGFLVIDKVCQFIRETDEKGVEFDAISCNLSSTQLCSEGFVDKVIEIANRNRINKMKLHFEITESVFADNFKHVANIMRKLSKYGIRFNLDDFGTGFSNIANMAELPFEFIKIDKSILYESAVSKKCLIVIQGLSRTFSDVGMKIVVEGVETLEHRKIAEQLNADYIQGFLFARPMPANEAIRYLGRAFSSTTMLTSFGSQAAIERNKNMFGDAV